jgi:hypothetical protein
MGTVKRLGALAPGGAILWQVHDHCGSMKCVVYVHVSSPGVDITVEVDAQTYRVETIWETPIVCELRPGRHLLRLLRSGRVLLEEEFTLAPGQEVVLAERGNELVHVPSFWIVNAHSTVSGLGGSPRVFRVRERIGLQIADSGSQIHKPSILRALNSFVIRNPLSGIDLFTASQTNR